MAKMNIKPGIPKRHLLLVATAVWAFAGVFLVYRGIMMMPPVIIYLWPKILLVILVGLLFFHLFFLRLSLRHITRIRTLDILRPCIFSFFNWKSFVLMAVMIASGILVRKSGWVDQEWVSLFFIAMAIPLILSAARFFRAWSRYKELVKS